MINAIKNAQLGSYLNTLTLDDIVHEWYKEKVNDYLHDLQVMWDNRLLNEYYILAKEYGLPYTLDLHYAIKKLRKIIKDIKPDATEYEDLSSFIVEAESADVTQKFIDGLKYRFRDDPEQLNAILEVIIPNHKRF